MKIVLSIIFLFGLFAGPVSAQTDVQNFTLVRKLVTEGTLPDLAKLNGTEWGCNVVYAGFLGWKTWGHTRLKFTHDPSARMPLEVNFYTVYSDPQKEYPFGMEVFKDYLNGQVTMEGLTDNVYLRESKQLGYLVLEHNSSSTHAQWNKTESVFKETAQHQQDKRPYLYVACIPKEKCPEGDTLKCGPLHSTDNH